MIPTQWHKVSDGPLPPLGTEVLACFEGQFGKWVIFIARMTREYGPYADGYAKPTHWADKPEPPMKGE
jgi:hypothetical protein